MSQQTFVAYFDQRRQAENAVEALINAGVHREAVRLHAQNGATARTDEDKGFWNTISDFFMPNEDRDAYDEGVRRGGAAVVVTRPGEDLDRIAQILDEHGAVDMDEREGEWRQSGWTGGAVVMPTGDTAQHGEEVIPVGEEHLRVGKREVNQGRVRVRSYTVETPVEEKVSLLDEDVQVETRSVDQPVEPGNQDLFRDRTIEAEEIDQQAVVAKEARVTDEVVVRKSVSEHTETIKDSVRHTEVDVDDDRTKKTR